MTKQLYISMRQGNDHVLDFEDEDEAKAALTEISEALNVHANQLKYPVTIAGRLVVIPADVRSAEVRESQIPLVA